MRTNYHMFTNIGNVMVSGIVSKARSESLGWYSVLGLLYDLSRIPEFSEAMDTAVREVVFQELGMNTRQDW